MSNADSPQPAGGLPELLRELSLQEPLEVDLDRVKSALLQIGMDLGSAEIEDLVQSWTKALRRSLSMDVPSEKVLCGFSSVLDTVYQLDAEGTEIKMFIEWVASKVNMSFDNLVDSAISLAREKGCGARIEVLTEGDGIASNLTEVVAVLIWCMENEGRKPLLQTAELQEQMEDYLRYRGEQKPAATLNPSLGGAAGNMCYILHELGLNVGAHWLYQPEDLADATPYRLTRVTTEDVVKEKRAREKGTYFAGDKLRDQPLRRNTSFEFPLSMPIKKESGEVLTQAKASDRAVFRTLMHRNPDRGWDNFVLRLPTLGGGKIDLAPKADQQFGRLGVDGWPFVPLFCSWSVEGRQLIIEVADDAVMEQVAERFDYFILTALMGIRDPITEVSLELGAEGRKGPNLFNIVRDHLIKQLRVLSEKGVVIHTEISAASASVFSEMSEVVLHGHIGSVGMNDDDLSRITGSDSFRGTRFFYSELEPDERDKNKRHLTTFRRYRRAVHLAKQLDVDELYVHGNDVDIVVRRHTSRGAIWRAIDALLLTKAAVVLALLKRAGTEMPELSPIPTANGFHGLVRFAKDFAEHRYPGKENKRKELFKEILDRKYFFERDLKDYSVIVAPVFWPNPSPKIVTVGAGDMTSSVVAIFSGK